MLERGEYRHMRKHLGSYKPFYTDTFLETLNSLSEKNKKYVQDKADDILRDPWHNQKAMKGQYRGRRRRWINKKNGDRIVYAICEDCRENRWTLYNGCLDCDDWPDETVTFSVLVLNHNY